MSLFGLTDSIYFMIPKTSFFELGVEKSLL